MSSDLTKTNMPAAYSKRPTIQQPKRQVPPERRKHHVLLWALVLIFIASGLSFGTVISHASATGNEVRSGISGTCLDNYKNQTLPDNIIDSWQCNKTDAQVWNVSDTAIMHDNNSCLGVINNAAASGSPIGLSTCNINAAGQVWLHDNGGYQNPNSGLCLTVPNGKTGGELDIENCNQGALNQQWIAVTDTGKALPAPVCSGGEGQKIACYAAQEWTAWQVNPANHENLLSNYTDGNAYEQWCADFVSYVYREAGYPFSQGERDNWDEYDANSIQYQGFTMHQAGSGYVPQTGDVAYFNYNQGHVEIVVSGGQTPTFVYGDSATIDPATGNGDMKANTIVNDGALGQLIYYLTPS